MTQTKPFAKKTFDPNLVDNYEDGFTGDKEKLPQRVKRSSFQRVIVALAISVRPRSTKELMWMAGISHRTNARRTIRSVGGIVLYKLGCDAYWGAPYMKDEPLPPIVEKYDDWLFGKAPWPAELGEEATEDNTNQGESQ